MWWSNCQIQEMSTQLERYKWVLLNNILEVYSNQLEGTLKSILNFENFENFENLLQFLAMKELLNSRNEHTVRKM